MTRVLRYLLGVVTLGLTLGLAVPAPAISEENEFPNDFGIVGLILGQTARLNVVNTIGDPEVMPCRVTLSFFDGEGNQLGGPDTKDLRPGGSGFSDVAISDENNRQGGRVQIRAVVTAHARSRKELRACSKVIQTLEVFSSETLSTIFVHPQVIRGFNPQPDPPGSVAGGQ